MWLSATLVLSAVLSVPFAQAATTVTTLTLSSSEVSSGTVVTFTASVSNGSQVTKGQVTFCDAKATYCEDSAIIGTAQLTSAGTALIRLIPGIGSHSYKAVFAGTTLDDPSISTAQSLTVTGTHTTTTAISSSGSVGNYTLTGTVEGKGSASLWPTGSVSFVDTTNGFVVGSAQLGASTLTQSFGSQVTYETGPSPGYVATGDFNGDGITDLVVTNWYSENVSVLLGNGDGSFKAGVNYAVGRSPSSVSIGDFNGDGIADIVVSNYYDNTVSVLLGNGDGSFQTQVTYGTGFCPGSIVIGDFNRDGFSDLAVDLWGGAPYPGGVSVLLGNGDGTFQSHWDFGAGIQDSNRRLQQGRLL
jgi:hypothetical protein